MCVVNILVWSRYFELVRWWKTRETMTVSPMEKLYEKSIKYLNRTFHLTIVLPIAFVMCAGPLFAPFAGMPLAQQVRRNAFTRIPLLTICSTNGRTSVTPSREKPSSNHPHLVLLNNLSSHSITPKPQTQPPKSTTSITSQQTTQTQQLKRSHSPAQYHKGSFRPTSNQTSSPYQSPPPETAIPSQRNAQRRSTRLQFPSHV